MALDTTATPRRWQVPAKKGGRRSGIDRRVDERRWVERRVLALPVATERRAGGERREKPRRVRERRIVVDRRALAFRSP